MVRYLSILLLAVCQPVYGGIIASVPDVSGPAGVFEIPVLVESDVEFDSSSIAFGVTGGPGATVLGFEIGEVWPEYILSGNAPALPNPFNGTVASVSGPNPADLAGELLLFTVDASAAAPGSQFNLNPDLFGRFSKFSRGDTLLSDVSYDSGTLTINNPEPSSLVLALLGLLGIMFSLRNK